MKEMQMQDLENVQTLVVFGGSFNMYGDEECPLFLATDIAEMIDYSSDKVGQMLENVDDDEKLTDTIYRAGQQRTMWFLTENGLYELLMQSRKPLAKAFKAEIKKALHDIRMGRYQMRPAFERDNRALVVEHAELLFRNFAGAPTKFTQEGVRSFHLVLDEQHAQDLLRDGWNVRPLKARDENDIPKWHLPVSVRFDNIPPKVYLVSKKQHMTLLTEDTVGMLDRVELENVDLTITPSNWELNGNSGVKAYLKNMYVTIVEDRLASKYDTDISSSPVIDVEPTDYLV